MKLLSSIGSPALSRVGFCRAVFFASISVALLVVPTLAYAQNSHKQTARHPHPRIDDTAPTYAEPETILTDGAAGIQPTSGPAISPSAPGSFTTVGPAWAAIGPTPIPNGQTIPADVNGISLTQSPVSGRVTSVAIDPGNASIVYVGAAQGGVYKSTNGGATWTRLMDGAMTLAVGSLELDPTDATGNTLLVGSGEGNFAIDSFAGFGVYKLTALKTGSPVLSGPFGSSQFSKRSMPGLAIDPNNHNVVYVGTATGQQGIGPQPPTPGSAPNRGLYRSTNFFSGPSTFTKIPMLGALEPVPPDYRVTSIVYEPGSSDRMFVGVADASGNNDPLY